MANTVAPSFGLSWSCVSNLTMPSIMVTGFRVVAEAVARIWQTPQGDLIDDPNYGYDLTDCVGEDFNVSDLGRVATAAGNAAERDQRVQECNVTLSLINGVLMVSARITTAQGPFTLVAAVSKVSVTLLQVQAA
jgi:phage baseplate assembly protein W